MKLKEITKIHDGIFLKTILLIVLATAAIFSIRQLTALTSVSMGLTDLMCPYLLSSKAVARNLNASSGDIVCDSFYVLTKRKDPVAVDRALVLVKSNDAYTWLNAALYLGACGKVESVPYLIKALRHAAWRSKPEEVLYLHNLTGKDFGDDFEKWKAWWEQTHPDAPIDWNSHLR